MIKKRLWATSAAGCLALATIGAGPAAAGERIRLRVEGEIRQWAVLAHQRVATGDGADVDTALLDQKHNSEIRFFGETALDHGLTVGVKVELEANTDEDQVSESYLFVELPRAGLVQIGDTDNAPVNMHVGAPDGGISVNDGDLVGIDAFVTPDGFDEGNTLIDATVLQLGDDTSGKISYYTPRFAGFQIGISYIPRFEDGGSDNDSISRTETDGPVRNGVALGLGFVEELGDLEIEAYAGYLYGDTPASEGSSNVQGAGAGLALGFDDVEIGGSFAWANGDTPGGASVDGLAFDLGIAYETGPYRVGLTVIRGISRGAREGSSRQRLDQAVLSGTYALAPGVALVGGVFWYDADGEEDIDADGDSIRGNRGFGFASALELGF
jgi:predicted porin